MKKIDKLDKLLFTFFSVALVLSLVLGLVGFNVLIFLSIAANLFLIMIFKYLIKRFNIKFSTKEKIFIILLIILLYTFYIISILTRKFIYYMDFSCYYNLQNELSDAFGISLFRGIRYFGGGTWSGEYGTFLSFFVEIFYKFSSKTINAYLISCVLIFIPYIILSFSLLIKKMCNNKVFIPSLLIFILMPILHSTFIMGQPDIFGMVFVFLIIFLTIDYNFKKIEFDRLLLLLILTFALIITRRWYMYFVIAYYIIYVIKILIENKKDFKIIITNGFKFAIISILFIGILLFPMFKNILINNYSSSYSFYLGNGFIGELKNQVLHLGILNLIIIMFGIVMGIKNKNTRLNSVLAIVGYFIIIYLFTRIQNMGLHHSLLLIIFYIYFEIILLNYFIKNEMEFFCYIIILTLLINFSMGIYRINDTKIFTNVPISVSDDENYKEIKNIAKWLKDKLNSENRAYMITHNNMINPDKFRNIFKPDNTISSYLPYGSSIIGVHLFPGDLLTAKYVITTTPFDATSIEYKYNEVFNGLVNENKFKLIKKFDLKNNYQLLIYERIIPYDNNEIKLYKDALKEESEKYKNLYENVLNEYLIGE